MLDLSNLKVDIEGSRILNGISLSVAAGELVCLVGRNGAGKTTTFRSIMGYRRARSGSISFDGADLTKLPTWRIAQLGIGFSPEESARPFRIRSVIHHRRCRSPPTRATATTTSTTADFRYLRIGRRDFRPTPPLRTIVCCRDVSVRPEASWCSRPPTALTTAA